MSDRTDITFSDGSGSGKVVIRAAGRRIQIGIEKESLNGRNLMVHAALTPEKAMAIRDALATWLNLQTVREHTATEGAPVDGEESS